MDYVPNREENGQQTVNSRQDHGHLRIVPTNCQRKQHGKAAAVLDEAHSAEHNEEADVKAGILENGEETLGGNENVASAMERSEAHKEVYILIFPCVSLVLHGHINNGNVEKHSHSGHQHSDSIGTKQKPFLRPILDEILVPLTK